MSAAAPLRGQPFEQFFHTAWTSDQGAPGAVRAMAQTADGYLWLGTQTGLTRFDGVRFERYESPRFTALPFNDVSALLATADGGLWIGNRTGGAAFLKNNKVLSYGEKDGMPSSQIFGFVVDAEGVVWAGTSRGPFRFENSRWDAVGADWNFTSSVAHQMLLDDAGRLWVVSAEKLYMLAPHSRHFLSYQIPNNAMLLKTRDGSLWTVSSGGRFPDTRPQPAPGQNALFGSRSMVHAARSSFCDGSFSLCAASDGSLWESGSSGGIVRTSDTEWFEKKNPKSATNTFQQFGTTDGLSDGSTNVFLEDREGNIWVSTRTGIDRFRRRNVYRGPPSAHYGNGDLSLVADRNGAIWEGGEVAPLLKVEDGLISTFGSDRHVACMYRDHAGTIWIGGWSTLTKFAGGRFEDLKLPAEIKSADQWKVRAIAEDGAGAMWISVVQHGVYRWKDNLWKQFGDIPNLPRLTAITLSSDPKGRVWFGYTQNRIALFDGRVARIFSAAEGLNVGNVTALTPRGDHLWAGGPFGLARFDGSRFVMLATQDEGDFKGISGIVETDKGDVWLNQSSGLVHISASEIESKLRDARHHVRYELFDNRDGLKGTATQLNFLPTAVLGTDGRIWVSGTEGASWIDPARIYKNTLPPPVSIQTLSVDGKPYPIDAELKLPPLPSNLQIDYTALSLSIPERVRFRYKLEGLDKDWEDVGTRRSAFYTRLAPGAYRFRVIACNNDGVWNDNGAALSFVVSPAFYQTVWFRCLLLTAVAGALCLFYLYHMRQLSGRLQERLGARLEERERIARELHDTLLQGFQGLMLRFQAVMKTLPENEPAQQMMEKVLDRADEVLLEGRQRVRDLRAEGVAGDDLPNMLKHCGEELSQDRETHFALTVVGTLRGLNQPVCHDAYRIGREAIVNAFQHALAAKIEVEITYDHGGVRLRIRDDGRGMNQAILDKGRDGHWGLAGMRERARKIGAKFSIWSRTGAGTEIEFRIPARIAYLRERSVAHWFRRGSATEEKV